MRFPLMFPIFVISVVALWSVACGSEEPDEEGTDSSSGDTDHDADGGTDSDSENAPDFSNDYYPMQVGAYWTYEETTSSGDATTLTYTVTEKKTMDFGGETGEREVFLVENTFDSLNEKRIQFIEDDGTRAVRHGHEVYDITETLTKTRFYEPGFLRFDRSKVTVGDKWEETVTRTTDTLDGSAVVSEAITYQFEIISVGEPWTIDLGTFNCIQIKRQDQSDFETKYYWYARGIGKIRELTGDKEEVLVDTSFLTP